MNKALFFRIFLVVFFIVIIAFISIIYLYQTAKSIKNENRIKDFALKSVNDKELSFFERIYNFIWQKIQKLGTKLNKTKYVKYYDKYAIYDEIRGCDYLALKIIITIIVLILGIALLISHFDSIYLISYLVIFLLCFFSVDVYLYIRYHQRKKDIQNNLLQAIIIINNDFTLGKTVIQALNDVCLKLEGYIAIEFKRIIKDITYGLDIEVAFQRFYKRIPLEEVNYIASSLAIYNKMGGNIAPTFKNIEKYLLDKKKFKTEILNYQVLAIWLKRIFALIPLVTFIIICFINPNYFSNYLNKKLGMILLIAICLLYILYLLIINKVIKKGCKNE